MFFFVLFCFGFGVFLFVFGGFLVFCVTCRIIL